MNNKYLLWSIEDGEFVEVNLPNYVFKEGFILHKAKYLAPVTQTLSEGTMTPISIETIDEFLATGLLKLPVGDFSISDPIVFDKISGMRIEGAGMSYHSNSLAEDYQVTRLFWLGDPNTPMIQASVRHGVFKDIQFVNGKMKVMPKAGIGTGLCFFDRVSFFGPTAEVIFGDVSYNGNAADSKFRDCQFINCDKCITTTTSQNVNYIIDGGYFYRTDTIFNVVGGGLITVKDSYLTQVPVVFTVSGDGAAIGSQNANFAVRDIKYDASQDVKPLLVRDTGAYGTNRELSILNPHLPPLGLDYVNSNNATWVIQDLTNFS
jgi:hypothetical protein